MRIKAVIGSSLGDEGKGRMVDYFSDKDSIVVRFNGGAQAGHTVVTGNGDRHVFQHFGAGTLKGASTYLSKFFIVNPITFRKEYRELYGKHSEVFVSPHCFVTTPWDMILNAALEDSRGSKRHGSCGYGINETVMRCNGSMPLNVQLLLSGHLKELLKHIQNDYVRSRLKDLGVVPSNRQMELLKSKTVFDNFIEDIKLFTGTATFGNPVLKDYDNIIFEGAQGLGLDQNHENFPHVTRSNTGAQNVGSLMEDFNLHDDVELVYVTRPYATRHGAGPFPTENRSIRYHDDTNTLNEHQGDIRFGNLDVNTLVSDISRDMAKIRVPFNPSLAMTCCDHSVPAALVDGEYVNIGHDKLRSILLDRLNFGKSYASFGEKSTDEVEIWVRTGVFA